MRASHAFVIVSLVTACTADVDILGDEGDEADEDTTIAPDDPTDVVATIERAAPGQVRVVQMNPYYAGRLAPYTQYGTSCSATTSCPSACSTATATGCNECVDHRCRARNWQTMTNAASLYDAINADLIGIEELNPIYAPKIHQILTAKTGAQWDYKVSAQGIGGKGSGIGAYWRADKL